ncbi:PhnD/SsuA/transferrin family substrate-binding protein [Pseudomonadota bacterium]
MNDESMIERASLWSRRRFLSGTAALGVGAGLTTALGCGQAFAHHPLTFGLTPVFLDSDIQLMSDMTDYFSTQVNHLVTPVKRRTYQEITSLLLSGGLSAAWICGFPYVQYRERIKLLAVPLYQGAPLYQSYLIVNEDGSAKTVADLRGTSHAFSDPNSNSGYLVTFHQLNQMKESPASFFSDTMFTYSHRNVIRAVSSGLTQSGSVDGYVWDVMAKNQPELVAGTRVIHKSEPMGFPPIACNADLSDDATVEGVAEALINMGSDPLGQKILSALHLDGFVRPDPSLYDGIADKYREVKDLL